MLCVCVCVVVLYVAPDRCFCVWWASCHFYFQAESCGTMDPRWRWTTTHWTLWSDETPIRKRLLLKQVWWISVFSFFQTLPPSFQLDRKLNRQLNVSALTYCWSSLQSRHIAFLGKPEYQCLVQTFKGHYKFFVLYLLHASHVLYFGLFQGLFFALHKSIDCINFCSKWAIQLNISRFISYKYLIGSIDPLLHRCIC